jgi:hypothetical protein
MTSPKIWMLHGDSSSDFIARVENIEHRADQCLEHFALLTVPTHIASWTILSATIHMIEDNYSRFGPDSSGFRAAMINLSRHAPMLIRWIGKSGMSAAPFDWIPRWESFVGAQAFRDLRVVANYDAFLNSYPMWHQNRLSAELLNNDVVRFRTNPDSRDRQISAFQKGLRRLSGAHQAIAGARVEPTEAILRRYGRILDAAYPEGAWGFSYEHPDELASRTFRKYLQRMEQIMRRSENLDLGVYTLGTFKRLYAALQSICAIHDFLCFQWGQRTGTYPIESAVLVKRRDEWIRLMSLHSGVRPATTEQLLSDLTFYSKRLPDLHVFPFVPLDERQERLALVPQFILGSSPEDNILRTCSYLRESSYSLLSDDKAAVMREDLLETLNRFQCDHSIPLPDGSTDIDLLVEDQQSSTVVIAELKWYRKPSTYRERLRADADFEDGYKRQLATIQEYCRLHPAWLKDRGSLKRSLSDYDNVFYLLIGRDHWSWFEPQDKAAVVEFEQFRLAARRHDPLNEAVREVLRYDWLPIEGEDFHVRYDRGIVEGVGVESEVYYGGPPAQISQI